MPDNIGKRIRDARLRKQMTQEDLARAIDTTKQNIYKYESGVITNIPLENVERIAAVLGVTPESLVGWIPEKQPPDEDIMEIRKALRRDPNMRILFSAASKVKPENIRTAAALLKALEPEEFSE